MGATNDGNGLIFQLKKAHGIWTNSSVHSFSNGIAGSDPRDLDSSSDGKIYGVAAYGQYGHGLVFKLTPNRTTYTYNVIYNFRAVSDGSEPIGINLDAATGNLYGTTLGGGTAGVGTVFVLIPSGDRWTETVVHRFTGGTNDGANPYSRPIVDRTTGALYGTTVNGGANNGGTVYMVQP